MPDSKYTLLKQAAAALDARLAAGEAPNFDRYLTFLGGKPCCAGGWLIWLTGYRPDPAIISRGARLHLFKYLGEQAPQWFMDKFHDLEDANDDISRPDIRLRAIGVQLRVLQKTLTAHGY